MKILLADDDVISRKLLQRTLERSGFQVVCAENGVRAAECLREPGAPRMAILDWMMPGLDGPDVCRAVRTRLRDPYVYLILLTSREGSLSVVEGLEAGADDYMTKPCHPEEMKARVRAGQRVLDLQDKLLHEAKHDALTGLPNRSFFVESLSACVTRAQDGLYRFAVLFVDIDRFKTINDSLGHLAGDELMKEVAGRLVKAVETETGPLRGLGHGAGHENIVARIGGDEFVILLDGIAEIRDGIGVAERINQLLQPVFSVDGQEVFITASIGISTSAAGLDGTEILRSADDAMYRAKIAGKARYEVGEPGANTAALRQLKLEQSLRRAVELNEFEVHYQPIVSLVDGRIERLEALVRWRHPTLGLIQPAVFIPVAEETGLILLIGEWVIREACRQMQAWSMALADEDPVTLCVNISPKQFERNRLVACVKDALRDTGLAPHQLDLELTENLTMQDAGLASEILRDLTKLGVAVSLDDFGTGYSSLSYLHRFPMRTLKIDRSFIGEIAHRKESRDIVQTIIALGHNLAMKVVAEGVETTEQMDLLKELGCDLAQGYLLSAGADPETVEEMLKDRSAGGTLCGELMGRLVNEKKSGLSSNH